MIEWTFFYRALGISDDAIRPTYYELLDLNPESCTPELVDEHRNQQRIRLRQSIPSPEFIPMILRFERHKLDHAAAVLRDPARKRQYDQHLAQKAEVQRHQEKKEKARRALVQKIREAVDKHLNPDKTLSDVNRPLLAAALRELGVKDNEVEEFLDKIPAPAKPTSRPSEEVIKYFAKFVDLAIRGHAATADAREWTMGMAHTLNISTSQADKIFDRILEKRGRAALSASQDEDDLEPYKLAEPIEEPQPVHRAEPFPDDSWSDVSFSDDELTAVSRLGSLRKIAIVVIPVVAIGLFALLVWFVVRNPRPPVAEVSDQSESRVDSDGSRGIGGGQAEGSNSPPEDSSELGGSPVAKDPEPNEPNTPVVAITPTELKASFTRTFRDEEILADVALTMSLCCVRAIQFLAESPPSDVQFEWMLTLTPTERQTTLTANVTLGDWIVNVPGMSPEGESKKPSDLSIIELVELDTPEAAQELLNRLSAIRITAGTRGRGTQTKQAARLVHALTQMHAPDIPEKLIKMIEESGSITAYLIVQALISKRMDRVEDRGRLTPTSYGWERKICAEWWEGHVPNWGGSPRGGRLIRPRSPQKIASAPSWQPDPDFLKLLAVVGYFAKQMGAVLAREDVNDVEALLEGLRGSPEIELTEPNTIAGDLLLSLQYDVRERLRVRILEKKPNDIEASAAVRRGEIRRSASITTLQEIVVEMDVITDLLGLFIDCSFTGGAVQTDVQDILRERTEAVLGAGSVMEQFRDSCYYYFVLWDRFLGLRMASSVP